MFIPLSYHVHPCPCFIQQIPRSQWWFLTECTTTVARSADLLATPSFELRFDLPELGPGSAENRSRPSAQRVSTCSCCVWKTVREHLRVRGNLDHLRSLIESTKSTYVIHIQSSIHILYVPYIIISENEASGWASQMHGKKCTIPGFAPFAIAWGWEHPKSH